MSRLKEVENEYREEKLEGIPAVVKVTENGSLVSSGGRGHRKKPRN